MTRPPDKISSSHPSDHETEERKNEVIQVEVTAYAYDPQTYEILCRPGQRLSEKKTRRLQELGLYAEVIKSDG